MITLGWQPKTVSWRGQRPDTAKDPPSEQSWSRDKGEAASGERSEMRASDCYLFHMQMRTFEIILQHKWEEFRPRPHSKSTMDEAGSETRHVFIFFKGIL